MKLKAIVATAASEVEANLIFAEIAKTHAFIEFFKIDGCQVTVIYEPDQSRLDRINREAEELRASLPVVEKSAMIKKQSVGIEDLEAKLCELGLDKDYLVTASAWSASKPQWYEVYHKWPSIKPIVIRSNSVDVVTCKLLEISDERQALMPKIEKTAQPCKTYLRHYVKGDRVFFFDHYHWESPDKMKLATAITNQCGNELSILVDGEEDFGPQWGLTPGRRVKVSDIYDIYDDADNNLIEEVNETEVKATPENKETEEEEPALPPIKKSADKLTIEDLEAKVKRLGLDKDLFVRVAISNPDKPQKYIIHDLDWNFQKPATFESKSAIAVSRKLTKIHKERQAAQVGHSLAVNPSQPIDIQKVHEIEEICPHSQTSSELNLYVRNQVKSQGQKYYCTEEYKQLFPKIKQMAQEEKVKTKSQTVDLALQAMSEVNANWGDRVEWHSVGMFMAVIVYTGIIVNRKGIPFVQLDASVNGKKSYQWHKGFLKLA